MISFSTKKNFPKTKNEMRHIKGKNKYQTARVITKIGKNKKE